MRRALVTGGAGFIGSHLVDGLLAQNWQVRVLDDFSTGNLKNLAHVQDRIDLIRGTITIDADARKAVEGVDTVFHLAALPSVVKSVEQPLLAHDICATGTLRVLDAARHAQVRRLVYAASSSAYGDQPGEVRLETDLLIPLSPYAAGKLAGEHYCSCYTSVFGLETVRLRFFNVFGPRQDAKSPYSGVIALFASAMKAGKRPTILGDGLQSRDFVYVANIVQALIQAADAPKASGGVYNIGMGSSITILDLARHLNALLGSRLDPLFGPPRPGDVRYSQGDISKARQDLGYDPKVAFQDGLAKTIADS